MWISSLSGRRDSNPRHQPWQGCALPTELLPHNFINKFKYKILFLFSQYLLLKSVNRFQFILFKKKEFRLYVKTAGNHNVIPVTAKY